MILWRDTTSLLALGIVPLLVVFFVWARRRRERALAAFVAAALLPAVAPDIDFRRRTVRWTMLTGAVLCLALALGGPMWGFRWQEVRRQGIDLVIAIDTSRSMLATDVKPNRLARAKLAVRDLVAEAHGGRPPVDLALGPGRRLEARDGAFGEQPGHDGLVPEVDPDEVVTSVAAADASARRAGTVATSRSGWRVLRA